MVSFIHLSDIHFNKYSGDPSDLDGDLRNELKCDIRDCLTPSLKNMKGILICGDIAYSGKECEYSTASLFLKELCEIIKVDKSDVFCVPGNHDVDQLVPKSETAVKLMQDSLSSQKSAMAFEDCLAGIFRGPKSSKLMYLPIENYNTKFAAQYNCNYTPEQHTWYYDLQLSTRYTLRLIGLNSTIISNEDDHKTADTERKMRLSKNQIPSRKKGIVYLTLCHHPPECWDDPDLGLQTMLNERVSVQLYGHKHLYTAKQVGQSLIIGSGATQPSRWTPDWIPRYNWISLDIAEIGGQDRLIVRVYPRVYSKECCRFVAGRDTDMGKDFKEYTLNICCTEKRQNSIDIIKDNESQFQECQNSTDWKRKFAYAFMNLPYLQREEILASCNLQRPEDKGKTHAEILNRIIERAESTKCETQLTKAVGIKGELI